MIRNISIHQESVLNSIPAIRFAELFDSGRLFTRQVISAGRIIGLEDDEELMESTLQRLDVDPVKVYITRQKNVNAEARRRKANKSQEEEA